MPAVTFIETRQTVQQEAMAHISKQLSLYEVETNGVYIQDVILPDALVQVLTPELLTYPCGKVSAFFSNWGLGDRKPKP
jgi:hypothetical protein